MSEARKRICPIEFVQWMAYYELRAELMKNGESALDQYQIGADQVLDDMDRELQRITNQKG